MQHQNIVPVLDREKKAVTIADEIDAEIGRAFSAMGREQ